tara:strand:+ start:324 stop:698 length:375 start_codon:yes stop_codon:yes gene_type:complete
MLHWLRWHWQLVVLFYKILNHKKLLSEVFDNLDEDDGRRYHLELRTLKRKVSKGNSNGSLTKPLMLRYEFFNALNSQQEEFFEENLETLIAMMASWLIVRKCETKKDLQMDDQILSSSTESEEE